MKQPKTTEGKGIKNIFNRFAGNKKCPKCKGEGSYMYDDIHGKVCELCCIHPKGFEIPDKRYYDDQTPTCFTCGKEKSKQPLKENWEKYKVRKQLEELIMNWSKHGGDDMEAFELIVNFTRQKLIEQLRWINLDVIGNDEDYCPTCTNNEGDNDNIWCQDFRDQQIRNGMRQKQRRLILEIVSILEKD